mmetsp:Transcript_93233/g.237179  ORF Transcript_93233/g.237179 Transcript_93233/m.237179 type:complete len:227 (-) Transcript_93233:150-830(-)
MKPRQPQGWHRPEVGQVPVRSLLVFTLLALQPAPAQAGGFLSILKDLKPPPRLLEQGKTIGRAVQAEVSKVVDNQDEAVKVLGTLGSAIGDVKPDDIDKVASDVLSSIDVQKEAADFIRTANPKLADALQHADTKHFVQALKDADPQEIENVIRAVGYFKYWKTHWQQPVLYIVLSFLASIVSWRLLRGRLCKRSRRTCVVMEESDKRLLEADEPLFARAALSTAS